MIKKYCLFHRFKFYDFYFGFYSSNVSNMYYLTKHLCIHHGLLLEQHFYSHPLQFFVDSKSEFIFGVNPTNRSIATPPVSYFILQTTNLFKSPIILTWLNSY